VRISVEVSQDVADPLARLADGSGSTPEGMLSRWLADAVGERAELGRRVAEGPGDLQAGRTIPHEDVMPERGTWAADLTRRHRTAQ
jgi:predicted transcriptional regulator